MIVTSVRIILDGSRYYLRAPKFEGSAGSQLIGNNGKPKYFTKRDAAEAYAKDRGWEIER